MVGFLLRQRTVVASQLNTRNVSCMVCSPTFGYLVKRNVGGWEEREKLVGIPHVEV